MNREELCEDRIICASHLPEPIEVMVALHQGAAIRLVARGIQSERLYTFDLSDEELAVFAAPTELNPERPHIPIVDDGKLTVPLYHGTSSIFYESIVKHGLGGRNVIQEFKVIELLSILVELCDAHLEPVDEWAPRMYSARNVVGQNVTSGGWNYRHGGVYLTPTRSLAARYAYDMSFGSEAIHYFMRLYERLGAEKPDLLESVSDSAAPLIAFVSKPGVPLVIEVKEVPISVLRTESGEDPAPRLQMLENLLNRKDKALFSVISQRLNFETTKPVTPSQLDFYAIGETYEYAMDDPPLNLYP
jgi:hypothetical protein